jgi:hypothetical protein
VATDRRKIALLVVAVPREDGIVGLAAIERNSHGAADR